MQVIGEIETYKFYNRTEMVEAKENWLSILRDAVEKYDTLSENDWFKINYIFVMHYLNLSNAMFMRQCSESLLTIGKVVSKVIEKDIVTDNPISNDSISTDNSKNYSNEDKTE